MVPRSTTDGGSCETTTPSVIRNLGGTADIESSMAPPRSGGQPVTRSATRMHIASADRIASVRLPDKVRGHLVLYSLLVILLGVHARRREETANGKPGYNSAQKKTVPYCQSLKGIWSPSLDGSVYPAREVHEELALLQYLNI